MKITDKISNFSFRSPDINVAINYLNSKNECFQTYHLNEKSFQQAYFDADNKNDVPISYIIGTEKVFKLYQKTLNTSFIYHPRADILVSKKMFTTTQFVFNDLAHNTIFAMNPKGIDDRSLKHFLDYYCVQCKFLNDDEQDICDIIK